MRFCLGVCWVFFFLHENFKCKFLTPVWNRSVFKVLTICLTEKKMPLILNCEEFFLHLAGVSVLCKESMMA